MEILRQLGELFLASVPTIILVSLFYFFLRYAFFTPITRVLAERSARLEGARTEAAKGQAAAAEKQGVYQEELKKARAQIYAEQEEARQKALEERAHFLRDARNAANEHIHAAKQRIAGELAAARREMEHQAPELAEEIVRSILAPLAGGGR